MHEDERKKATENVFRSLKKGGIYVSFENVIPEDAEVKEAELLHWGRYQQRHGKTQEEAKAHIRLLKQTGFRHVHVFWYSYMQMGIYGVK